MWSAFLGVALAAEPPDVAVRWVSRLEAATPQAAERSPAWGPEAPAWPLCPLPSAGADGSIRSASDPTLLARWSADPMAVMAACQALTYRSWELWMEVKPGDQRVFAPLRLRVTALPEGVSGPALLRSAVAEGAVADRGGEAVLAVGGYLVEVHVPCKNAALLSLEVRDLVAGLAAGPSPLPVAPNLLWSACGRESFVERPLAEVLEDAARPRSYFGIAFPEARDAALGRPPAP
jgi:hypothetical protein